MWISNQKHGALYHLQIIYGSAAESKTPKQRRLIHAQVGRQIIIFIRAFVLCCLCVCVCQLVGHALFLFTRIGPATRKRGAGGWGAWEHLCLTLTSAECGWAVNLGSNKSTRARHRTDTDSIWAQYYNVLNQHKCSCSHNPRSANRSFCPSISQLHGSCAAMNTLDLIRLQTNGCKIANSAI